MLQPFFEWLNNLAVSRAINESLWIFAVVQAFHLVALAVFAGALLMVDLRLLGGGFTQQPVARVARDARPWLIWSLAALVVTGIPQLMSNASREYFSDYFWFKMYVLVVALIFTFTIRQWVAQRDDARATGPVAKLVGLASIILWSGVAIPARLIGLFT